MFSKDYSHPGRGWFTLLLASFFVLAFMRHGHCSADTLDQTQEQSIMLIQLLTEQEQALSEALTSLEQAKTALAASDEALEQSQDELTALSTELAEARQQLTAQQQEIERLSKLLTVQQKELNNASSSIKNANNYLAQAKAEMITQDKAHQKKEKKLKVQKTFWQIIAGICAGFAVSK